MQLQSTQGMGCTLQVTRLILTCGNARNILVSLQYIAMTVPKHDEVCRRIECYPMTQNSV